MGSCPSSRSIRVLGTFAARYEDRRLVVRPSPQRLLALLAVHGDLTRRDAVGLLWPDLPQQRAQANLRTVLWRVGHDAPGFVAHHGDTLALPGVETDLAELRGWAWSTLNGTEPWPPAPRSAGLELLPGWSDEWLVQPREELRLLQLHALEGAGQRLLMGGRIGEAAGMAVAAVGMDPLRESANRLLIEVHLRAGNSADALRQFRSYGALLRTETGTRPGAGLAALIGAAVGGGPGRPDAGGARPVGVGHAGARR